MSCFNISYLLSPKQPQLVELTEISQVRPNAFLKLVQMDFLSEISLLLVHTLRDCVSYLVLCCVCVCVVPCSTVCVASHTLRDCVWLLAVITATTQPPHGSSSPFSSADDGSKPSVNVRNTGISEPCSLYTTWCKTTRFLCTRSCKG